MGHYSTIQKKRALESGSVTQMQAVEILGYTVNQVQKLVDARILHLDAQGNITAESLLYHIRKTAPK